MEGLNGFVLARLICQYLGLLAIRRQHLVVTFRLAQKKLQVQFKTAGQSVHSTLQPAIVMLGPVALVLRLSLAMQAVAARQGLVMPAQILSLLHRVLPRSK